MTFALIKEILRRIKAQTVKSDLKINGTIDFDATTTCVVPPVTRISQVQAENQVTGYRNSETGKSMTVSAYNTAQCKLGVIISPTLDQEVELTRFEREWKPEETQIQIHVDYKFEVLVREESGNQTISEREFETEDDDG